eukprot:2690669-Amphidinium_carterae.1
MRKTLSGMVSNVKSAEPFSQSVLVAQERGPRGEVMCIWDDDDIFPIDRIRQQVPDIDCNSSCSDYSI